MPPSEVSQYGDIHDKLYIKKSKYYQSVMLIMIILCKYSSLDVQHCVGVHLAAFSLVIECNWSFCTHFLKVVFTDSLHFTHILRVIFSVKKKRQKTANKVTDKLVDIAVITLV